MTNLLFIGQHFPPGLHASIMADTRGRAGFSNHNFETALLRGFAAREDTVVRAITLPLQYSWPASSSRPVIDSEKDVVEGVAVRGVGYLNLPAFSILASERAMRRAIEEELQAFPPGDVEVVVNTPVLPAARALRKIRRSGPRNIRTTLILPDIPSCVASMAGMKGLKGRIFGRINDMTMKEARRYDRYVFLTEAMNDFFHVSPERMMVMEGLVDMKRIPRQTAGDNGEDTPRTAAGASAPRVILYTGSLFEVFGVMRLVEAFLAGDFRDTELWICGSGDMAPRLEDISSKYPQVKFHGLVSADEALAMQRRATVLANPRAAAGEYTKYSFPSKTLEYLASGRPVVMNPLPGIPAEYDPYLTYPADESPQAWTRALHDLLDMPPADREALGRRGREFVERAKTAEAQTQRIIEFITAEE